MLEFLFHLVMLYVTGGWWLAVLAIVAVGSLLASLAIATSGWWLTVLAILLFMKLFKKG